MPCRFPIIATRLRNQTRVRMFPWCASFIVPLYFPSFQSLNLSRSSHSLYFLVIPVSFQSLNLTRSSRSYLGFCWRGLRCFFGGLLRCKLLERVPRVSNTTVQCATSACSQTRKHASNVRENHGGANVRAGVCKREEERQSNGTKYQVLQC